MKVLLLLKGKLLLTVASVVLVAGGATAVFASTPAGQAAVQSITHGQSSATAGVTHTPDHDPSKTPEGKKGSNDCPGLADAQNLATKFHLSTDAKGDAVQAFCALHQGNFKGTTRVYGYGEVEQLLTYAQYLASHDSINAGGKLTDANVSGYLADALHNCGTTPLATCLKTKIPGYQPGKGGDNNGNGNGKPTTTPTPPTSTGTPGHKPTVTPTPHA